MSQASIFDELDRMMSEAARERYRQILAKILYGEESKSLPHVVVGHSMLGNGPAMYLFNSFSSEPPLAAVLALAEKAIPGPVGKSRTSIAWRACTQHPW